MCRWQYQCIYCSYMKDYEEGMCECEEVDDEHADLYINDVEECPYQDYYDPEYEDYIAEQRAKDRWAEMQHDIGHDEGRWA